MARIPVFKIRPSQEILKIRDGTSLEAEGILTYRKKISRNGSVWHFSNKLDVPSNVVQKKRVARILVFKIRPSQEILKIRDGTPMEAEGLLTYRKKPSKWIEILKTRDGTPLELDKKIVARILVFKIRPSQEILKIRDGTPLEAEGILTYRKKIPRNGSVWHFSNKLDVPSNVVQKKRVARIPVFKIRPSQEILKIRDGTSLEAEGILTYRKKISRNGSVWHFSNKLDVPSNVVQKKRVARILVFKIRPSQEILKIRDGTPLEAEGLLTYRKKPSKWIEILKTRDVRLQKKRVARIPVFKIRPSQEILKIRDGTSLEAEGILTYRKKISRNGSVWHFSNKLDVPSNVVQKKRVARILVFKIRPSQEILKIRDGTPLEAEGIFDIQKKALEMDRPSQEILKTRDDIQKIRDVQKKRVARIPVFKIRPSQEILKIRDGTSLEAEGILTYRKKISRNGSVWHFSNKLDVPSNVVQKKRVARILVFKIRPSQEILKIRDGTPMEAEGLLTYRKKPSKWIEILKTRDVRLQKKRVARIPVFKIRPSQEILKIRDGTSLEAEGILTYRKKISRNGSVWHFSNKLDVPSNVVQKKRVARILVFKIRPSQEILKIRDGTPLEAEGLLTYRKKPSKWIGLALF
ncbi:hypothetical protein OROHE_020363 [Orobanche hederae]